MSVKFEMDGQVAIATFAAPPMNLLTNESIEAFGDAAQAALDANARAFLTLAGCQRAATPSGATIPPLRTVPPSAGVTSTTRPVRG